MGKRGPAPKPVEQCVGWRGNPKYRGSNGYKTPKPKKGRPAMPFDLSDDAKDVWRRTLPILERQRTLSKDDLDYLKRYCATFAIWDRCRAIVDVTGVGEKTKTGSRVTPEAHMMSKLGGDLERQGDKLGLNPSSRTRMQVPPEAPSKDDDVLKFLPQAAER